MIDVLLVMLAAGVGGLAGVYLLMSINEAREDKRLEDEYQRWIEKNICVRETMSLTMDGDCILPDDGIFTMNGDLWQATSCSPMDDGRVRIQADKVLTGQEQKEGKKWDLKRS